MNKIKTFLLCAILSTLVACGHGYEGVYQKKVGSDEKLLNALAGLTGSETVKIGRDYIEINGVKEKFNKIFVRKEGEQQFLIFQNGNTEKSWKIVDKNTLMQGTDLVNVKLIKIPT